MWPVDSNLKLSFPWPYIVTFASELAHVPTRYNMLVLSSGLKLLNNEFSVLRLKLIWRACTPQYIVNAFSILMLFYFSLFLWNLAIPPVTVNLSQGNQVTVEGLGDVTSTQVTLGDLGNLSSTHGQVCGTGCKCINDGKLFELTSEHTFSVNQTFQWEYILLSLYINHGQHLIGQQWIENTGKI